MSWRRHGRGSDAAAEAEGQAQPAVEPASEDPEVGRLAALEVRRRALGPFDAAEVPSAGGRIDLGALRLTPRPGLELRLEVEEATQRVVAATLGVPGSSVQVHVFASPRTDGVWDEVRGEIAASVEAQGGTAEVADVADGFGRELLARLPARTTDGRTGHVATRFVGVDGPRWFLRAVFAGAAALDRSAAAPLEEVVRSLVVVRGEEAMAPRDLLVLRLPPGAAPRPVARQAPPSPAPQAAPPDAPPPGAPPLAGPPPAAPPPDASPPPGPAPVPVGSGARPDDGGRS